MTASTSSPTYAAGRRVAGKVALVTGAASGIGRATALLLAEAGISASGPLAELPLEDWRRVLTVNLEGALLGTQHAIRAMHQHGQGGSIVQVASISGIKAQPGAAAYCTSKAAIRMLSPGVRRVPLCHRDRSGHRPGRFGVAR